MPHAWYLAPYRLVGPAHRQCEIEQYFDAIGAEGGDYRYVEVLGGYGVVKVRASSATLTMLAGLLDWRRLPKDRLDDPLSDLTTNQRNQLRDVILSLGYSLSELQARFPGDLRDYTLRQVLRFAATRRLKPVLNTVTGEVTLSGEVQPCSPQPDELDTQVQ